MGFLARLGLDLGRRIAPSGLALALVLAAAGPGAAHHEVPGPPLAEVVAAPQWGSFCPAPTPSAGPWHAAGFGAAVLLVAGLARRSSDS